MGKYGKKGKKIKNSIPLTRGRLLHGMVHEDFAPDCQPSTVLYTFVNEQGKYAKNGKHFIVIQGDEPQAGQQNFVIEKEVRNDQYVHLLARPSTGRDKILDETLRVSLESKLREIEAPLREAALATESLHNYRTPNTVTNLSKISAALVDGLKKDV